MPVVELPPARVITALQAQLQLVPHTQDGIALPTRHDASRTSRRRYASGLLSDAIKSMKRDFDAMDDHVQMQWLNDFMLPAVNRIKVFKERNAASSNNNSSHVSGSRAFDCRKIGLWLRSGSLGRALLPATRRTHSSLMVLNIYLSLQETPKTKSRWTLMLLHAHHLHLLARFLPIQELYLVGHMSRPPSVVSEKICVTTPLVNDVKHVKHACCKSGPAGPQIRWLGPRNSTLSFALSL